MAETEIIERSGDRVTVKCAFCDGTGLDPFGVMSILSTCQVCRGSGKVTVTEPFVTCPFCNGTGVHPSRRYTCIVCKGKGVVSTPPEELRVTCPTCDGSGQSRTHWNVPCLMCKGKGFIPVPPVEERQECPQCQGIGKVTRGGITFNIPCPRCKGKGFIAKT